MGRTACTEPECLYKGALYLLYLNLHTAARWGRSKTQFLSILSPTADVRIVFMKFTSYPCQYVCHPKISELQSYVVVELLTVIRILFPNLRFTPVDTFILMGFPSLKFQVMSFVTVIRHVKIFCNFGCDQYGRTISINLVPVWTHLTEDSLQDCTRRNDVRLLHEDQGASCTWRAKNVIRSLKITNLTHNFFVYVYFYSLHVSGNHVPIISRMIVSVRHLVYVTLCR